MFSLAHSWSELTWQQLQGCWRVKLRYAGKPDVARVAALMVLCSLKPDEEKQNRNYAAKTGERIYSILSADGGRYFCTARELSWLAKQALAWFDYPYGDPGEKELRDDKGKVIREHRASIPGYVSPMHDAMILPKEHIKFSSSLFTRWFQLPQAACANLTWEQYRALQNITPQLFSEGNTEEQAIKLQAKFLANILTPRSFALLDTTGGNIKIRPHYVYQYNSERAERLATFWEKALTRKGSMAVTLFHLCFQTYQTALGYYSEVYPLLFAGDGKQDPLKDALTGEVGTINTIMKYQGYTEPQAVYDTNLPIILDVLNTMTKEAKEIEKMNAKVKKRK